MHFLLELEDLVGSHSQDWLAQYRTIKLGKFKLKNYMGLFNGDKT